MELEGKHDSVTKWGISAAVVVLLGAVLFGWWQAPEAGFVLDDYPVIVAEEANILEMRDSGWWIESSRPVVALTFILDGRLHGMNPAGWHWTNMIIHMLATLALFELTRQAALFVLVGSRLPGGEARFAIGIGFCAALVWAVHPLQTETVTYIVQRSEALAALFVFAGMLCVVLARRYGRVGIWSVAIFILGTLAIQAKPSAVSYPILVLLLDLGIIRYSRMDIRGIRWPLHLGAWLVILVFPFTPAGSFLLPNENVDANPGVGFGIASQTPLTYALAQFDALVIYLGLVVWPDELLIDRFDQRGAWSWSILPGLLLFLFWLAIGIIGLVRRVWWGAVALMFLAALLPTSSIVPVVDVVVEHRMYLPLFAIAVLFAGGVAWIVGMCLASRSSAGRSLAWCMAILVLGIGVAEIWRTRVRNLDYIEGDRLWRQVLEVDGGSILAKVNLSTEMLRKDQPLEALTLTEEVLVVDGGNVIAHINAGIAHLDLGQPVSALEHFQFVDRQRAGHPVLHGQLGDAYRMTGDFDLAEFHYKKAIERHPSDSQTMLALANIMVDQDRVIEALEYQDRAISAAELSSDLDMLHSAHFNRGNSAFLLARWEEAADHYRASLAATEDSMQQAQVEHWLNVVETRAAELSSPEGTP